MFYNIGPRMKPRNLPLKASLVMASGSTYRIALATRPYLSIYLRKIFIRSAPY